MDPWDDEPEGAEGADADLHAFLGARRGRRDAPGPAADDAVTGRAGPGEQVPPPLPGYTMGAVLGSGSSGLVWRGERADGLQVAVKVVEARGGDLTPAMREASVLSRVHHEHVVRLHDVLPLPPREPGGTPRLALVMQLADGGSLAQVVRSRGHLTPGEVVTVLCPLATALHELHRQGVVHGDVAPSNVLFLASGRPVLADLGVCRVTGDPDRVAQGTRGMVAPELMDGWPPTEASDVYAVGALAWHALTGRHPGWALDRRSLEEERPDLADTPLLETIETALATDPDRRPEADELAARLYAATPAEPLILTGTYEEGRGLTRRLRRDRRPGPQDAPAARRVPRRVVLGVVVALVLAALALATDRLWPGDPSVPAPDAAWPAQVAPTSAPPAVDSVEPTGGPVPPGPGDLPAPAPPPEVETSGTDPPRPADTPPLTGAQAREQVQALVDARAQAWASGDVEDLLAAHAAGSPALQQDAGALAEARGAGVRYAGLSFAVDDAGPVRPAYGERVQVDVVLVRSAYEVRPRDDTEEATREVPASEPEDVALELVDTADGWRVWAWD